MRVEYSTPVDDNTSKSASSVEKVQVVEEEIIPVKIIDHMFTHPVLMEESSETLNKLHMRERQIEEYEVSVNALLETVETMKVNNKKENEKNLAQKKDLLKTKKSGFK